MVPSCASLPRSSSTRLFTSPSWSRSCWLAFALLAWGGTAFAASSASSWHRGDRSLRQGFWAAPSAAVSSSTGDPIGDTFGAGSEQPDLTGLSASSAAGNLLVSATLTAPIDSGNFAGFIDLDTDQDAATGRQSWVDFLTGNDPGLGNEFYVDLFSYSSSDGSVDIVDENDETVVGRAPLTFSGKTFSVQIPLMMLGDDDGAVNLDLIVGTIDEVTDYAPNQGHLSTQSAPQPVVTLADRFDVAVQWSTAQETQGNAKLVQSSTDSAVLYFFEPDNWEMLIKVLDGCGINDHYWVFFAATTDVEFTVTVTDTANGTQRQYSNPLHHPASAVTDTSAFDTCP